MNDKVDIVLSVLFALAVVGYFFINLHPGGINVLP